MLKYRVVILLMCFDFKAVIQKKQVKWIKLATYLLFSFKYYSLINLPVLVEFNI